MVHSSTPELPSFAEPDQDGESTAMNKFNVAAAAAAARAQVTEARRPFLIALDGRELGASIPLDKGMEIKIGRGSTCEINIEGHGVSRQQAVLRFGPGPNPTVTIQDLRSANGTFVNGRMAAEATVLHEGDKVQLGLSAVFRFSMLDEEEQRYHRRVRDAMSTGADFTATTQVTLPVLPSPWHPDGWREKHAGHSPTYEDPEHLARVFKKLALLPPLVTSWEVEDLKRQIADAQEGRRILLQGGDCAETFDDCQSANLGNKLKILTQMSLVLVRGARRPVIRVGRFAGQYAKPRSKTTETRDGVELPSYLGDIVNRAAFTKEARRPDPELLLTGYFHAAVTINFIRSLAGGGLSDLRKPEYFDLFFRNADLPSNMRHDYQRLSRELSDGLHFLQAMGDKSLEELMRVTFFTSHEALSLHYEAAQVKKVPRSEKFYDLTTHLPWIGERTRALDGAHVDLLRGVANPIGVKVGPNADPLEVLELARTLNPLNEPGKLVLICRLGVKNVEQKLAPIISAVTRAERRVLWVVDPMHGNAIVSKHGVKTRNFDDILKEVELSMDVHRALGTTFGGVHFELTGEDVTECIGGGLGEDDLDRNYATLCDPRLNYRQAVEIAFAIARRFDDGPAPATVPPPPPPTSRR